MSGNGRHLDAVFGLLQKRRRSITDSLSRRPPDMTIICKNEAIPCHAVAICAHSWVLRTAYQDACKRKRQTEEIEESEIDLSEDDLPTVRRMIRYCYTLDYSFQDKGEDEVWVWADDNMAAESVDPAPAVLLGLHRQMRSIAKKYGIDTLERVALSRLCCLSEVIAKNALWSRVPFDGLVRMVPKLQGVTFEGSRSTYSVLVDTLVKRTVDDPSMLTDEGFKEICGKYPGFASEVKKRSPQTPTEVHSGGSSRTDTEA